MRRGRATDHGMDEHRVFVQIEVVSGLEGELQRVVEVLHVEVALHVNEDARPLSISGSSRSRADSTTPNPERPKVLGGTG